MAEVEAGVLEAMKSDPSLAAKHPGILKSIKAATGLSTGDDKPLQPTFNVNEMRLIIKRTLDRTEEVVDAEVVPQIEDAEFQLFNIKGMVRELPKGWWSQASICGYDGDFCTLVEMFFLPHVVDKVTLTDFLIAHRSLKGSGKGSAT